jgi:hypothetical protein
VKRSRPGILAVRTVNDYRRRDVFGFLGVRYYLDNSVSGSDEWAKRVSISLAMTKSQPGYFNAEHFKEQTEEGGIEHRSLFIPAPNECLAEEVLLAECARRPRVFGNPDCVYSYSLNEPDSRTGAFLPYTHGLQRRQAAIAKACAAVPNGIVRYTDIKKFYPSVDIKLARAAWNRHCREAGFPEKLGRLGERLIEGHAASGLQAKPAILTGPMFSQLLANLVFRDIDRELSSRLPVAYFRYVDDIALVGEKRAVDHSLSVVRERIASLGLMLHDDGSPKNVEVPCSEWLPSRDDFTEKRGGISWMRLIGNLKRYLLQHPEDTELLHNAFLQEGFRIPVRDYSSVIREQDFAHQMLRYAPWNWFRRKAQSLSVPTIVQLAKGLRNRLDDEFQQILQGAASLTGYERKRRISKLRYCIARLVYLAPESRLLSLASDADALPELFFHAQVMQAVASRRIDRILAMGVNAAQATAQPLRAAGGEAISMTSTFQKAKEQSLAVFLMNGVTVRHPTLKQKPESELIRFASLGADRRMMRSDDAFLREVACLHGISKEPRHMGVFDFAFDEDEALSMDAVTQLQQSIT